MSDQMLLSVAGVVFAMLLIGLGLTIWEFRHGQPRRDARAQQPPRDARQAPPPPRDDLD